ncbi:hypothetical protein BH23ACT10_BH23ACT10_27640 [soil metagenome]
MTNILTSGLHKTGTTGLYNAVKRAVVDTDPPYVHLFEPKDPTPFAALDRYAPQRPILTKILVHRLGDCEVDYDSFPRRVMTVRDPRDIAISRLLFRPLYGWTSYHIDPRRLDPFVTALKEKEADPSSHSVLALHRLATELGFEGGAWDTVQRQMAELMRVVDAHDFHMLRYEDFVDGRLDAVSGYLDMEITNPRATDIGWLSHIPRSMGYGEWRHWFLDEDDRYFGELFADFMQRFGYDDWSRPPTQVIEPATSSDYVSGKVAALIDERQDRQSNWSVEWVTEPEQVEDLRSMAADGRSTWAFRLASVLSRGVVDRDPDGAIHWAREAAILGHKAAIGLLIRLLADHRADDPLAQGERRFWELERRRVKAETDTLDELRQLRRAVRDRDRELARIRRSTGYRVARLARVTRRDPRAALATLVRAAKRTLSGS